MGLVAFFVASTVVTLLQFLRVRDRRLLPLLAMFALLGVAHFLGEGDGWGRGLHFGAGLAGLALLVAISPRHVAARRP
jgi:hypothetical protein